jgi:hypothetical protein
MARNSFKIDREEPARQRRPAATIKSERQVFAVLRLMQRGAGGMPQALNLVLDHQLPALEFDNLQIIC